MPTVTGIVREIDGSFAASVLLRATGVRYDGNEGYAAGERAVDCVEGLFTIELVAGVWEMLWSNGNGKVNLTVPSAAGTYNWRTLVYGYGIPASMRSGSMIVVADVAAMKALEGSEHLAGAILQDADPGLDKIYYFVFGDSTTADGFNVIAPDDDSGRFFAADDGLAVEMIENGSLDKMKSFSNAVQDEFTNIISADVIWPDGSEGVYTVLATTETGFVDSYQITHTSSGKTVTQPAYTRDETGKVIARPPLELS